jgi:hypothetical protein
MPGVRLLIVSEQLKTREEKHTWAPRAYALTKGTQRAPSSWAGAGAGAPPTTSETRCTRLGPRYSDFFFFGSLW